MNIFDLIYSYLSEGYSVATMALSACSSVALAVALVIGIHLRRRNQTMAWLLIWFVLMASAAVSASGWDKVASAFVATLIWKVTFMGIIMYGVFWVVGQAIKLADRLFNDGNY